MNIQQIDDNRLNLYSKVISKKKIQKIISHTINSFISFTNINENFCNQLKAEITVRFTNKSEIKKLNFNYRKKDNVTDVLTFIYHPFPNLSADIVICLPFTREFSHKHKISNENNLCHLLVHGTLHAAGLDHIVKKEAIKMEMLEIQTLNYFKISNPYEY